MFSQVEILTCHVLHKYNKRSFFHGSFYSEKFNSQRSLFRREVYFREISLFQRDFFISERFRRISYFREISYFGDFLTSENLFRTIWEYFIVPSLGPIGGNTKLTVWQSIFQEEPDIIHGPGFFHCPLVRGRGSTRPPLYLLKHDLHFVNNLNKGDNRGGFRRKPQHLHST